MTDGRTWRWWVAGGALAAVLAAPIPATPAGAAPAADASRGDQDRLTMVVYVNGKGPYSFLVDTAATHSVISQRVASALALADAGVAELQDAHGRTPVRLVHIDRLQIGARTVDGLAMPVLRAEDIGADGILGFDSFEGQRISIDAKRNRVSVMPAAAAPDNARLVVRHVTAVTRRAQMFITDADIDGWPVTVLVDSGASSSVINGSMRRLLRGRDRRKPNATATLVGVTGSTTPVEVTRLGRLRMGDFVITDAPVAVADLDIFRQLDLADRPAILLGMNLLKTFDRVDLDFQRKRVSFVVRQDAIQMALETQFAYRNGPAPPPLAPIIPAQPVAPPPSPAAK